MQSDKNPEDAHEFGNVLWNRLQTAIQDGARLKERIMQLESEKSSLEAFFVGDADSTVEVYKPSVLTENITQMNIQLPC